MSLSSLLTNPTTETIIEVYVANMMFSAFVQSLPAPDKIWVIDLDKNPTVGRIIYTIFYNLLSALASDFKSFQKVLPQPTNTLFSQTTTLPGKTIITEGISTTNGNPVKKTDPLNG
jgi:hypothetical protein